LTLKFYTSASYRSIQKIISIICFYTGIELKAPSHTTILNWTKKMGLYHIQKQKPQDDDWIIILDESIEFGNEKMLAILGTREKDIDFTRALHYQDLECLDLKISSSWKGEDIEEVINQTREHIGNIKYAIADMGNAIKKSLNLAEIPHVEDLTHKLSWIIKQIYEKDPEFINYTKKLAYLRGSIPLSKLSYILPPAQRVHSRFMNLKPMLEWSNAVISLLKTDKQLPEERKKLQFILDYEPFIKELTQIVEITIRIQEILKNNGVSQETITKCKQLFPTSLKSAKLKSFKNKVFDYLLQMYAITYKLGSNKIICSSDILESSFGKYKSFIHANPSIGITDLSLAIPAFIGNFKEQGSVCEACEKIRIEDVKKWRFDNIGKTLLKKRQEAFNKLGEDKWV